MSILIAILVFGVVIFVHECGHFFAARRCGIGVDEFAMGMGPKLLSKKVNGTMYSLRLIPIGGYCKMHGEDTDSGDPNALNNKKVWQRMIVMAAGSLMNFLLAFLIFFVLVLLYGAPSPTIRTVMPNSAAEQSGLRPGDTITAINGSGVHLYEDIIFALEIGEGQPIAVNFLRDGTRHRITLTPLQDENGDYKIGFISDSRLGWLSEAAEGYQRIGFMESLSIGFYRIIFYVRTTVVTLIRLVTFRADLDGMAGPIGIVRMIDETYQATILESVLSTILNMLYWCALISANLGAFNLLPIPALDGARLVFLVLEGIRRKPVPPEREGMVHFVGFVLLMILAIFIAFMDITR